MKRTIGMLLIAMGFGLAHALIHVLSFPPFDVWWLTFVSITPLVLLAANDRLPLRVRAVGAWIAFVPAVLFQHPWMGAVTTAGYPVLAAYLSLYPALFVVLVGWVRRHSRVPLWASAVVIWMGLEFARGEIVWHGYPWFLIAHPTVESGLARMGPWIGAYGVGVLVCVVGAAIGELMFRFEKGNLKKKMWPALAAAAVLVVSAVISWPAIEIRDGNAARIAVVQTNVPQSNRMGWSIEQRLMSFEEMMRLTVEAAGSEPKPDVIVWPETMFPGTFLTDEAVEAQRAEELAFRVEGGAYPATGFRDELVELQARLGIPMIVGAIGTDGFRVVRDDERGGYLFESDAEYNSAFQIDGGAVREERYDKLHLTPFGEVMPYISSIEWLEKALLAIGARGMSFSLSAGTTKTVFEIPVAGGGAPIRIVTPICFEVTMSDVCRGLVFEGGERRADVMINMTNDGWFGWFDAGREAHVLCARWRCIELGTPMVRAANTGITCAIDARGRIQKSGPGSWEMLEPRTAGVLQAGIDRPETGRPTVYGRIGNWAGWLSLLGTVGLMGTGFVGRRLKHRRVETPTKE